MTVIIFLMLSLVINNRQADDRARQAAAIRCPACRGGLTWALMTADIDWPTVLQ
ncbi:hypothetical protein [Mycolicibacterium mengxianglii]|uniref:hypothetical protein n=1 Tax=Mycolicibacterium mengxianglii TaxID=2736649 RepID=UPI0018D10711|nr:hypothetical protein [Mycolicibacterium mengxianglii]